MIPQFKILSVIVLVLLSSIVQYHHHDRCRYELGGITYCIFHFSDCCGLESQSGNLGNFDTEDSKCGLHLNSVCRIKKDSDKRINVSVTNVAIHRQIESYLSEFETEELPFASYEEAYHSKPPLKCKLLRAPPVI